MFLENKRINFDFNIHETYEAGIVLTGAEVKSIRDKAAGIVDCYVAFKANELWLINWNVPKYKQSFQNEKYDPKRARKLLLKRTELARIAGSVKRNGYTIVVSKLYTNKRGYIKLELALVTGKKKYDKRQYIKEKDLRREAKTKFND